MPIELENVGIAVRELEETIARFTDLGMTVVGRDTQPVALMLSPRGRRSHADGPAAPRTAHGPAFYELWSRG